MTNKKNIICNCFEEEILLYTSGELSTNRISYWENHLQACSICSNFLNEYYQFNKIIENSFEHDLEESVFNRIIDKAVHKNNRLVLSNFFDGWRRNEKYVQLGKIAFASVVVIIAIILSIMTDKPSTEKNINKGLLDWDSEFIADQFNEIKNRIDVIRMSNLDKWNREINLIDKKINQLENQSDTENFY